MTSDSYSKSHPHLCLLLAVFVSFGLLGCSQQMRYRTLTFFFTGVPDPNQKSVIDSGKTVNLAELARQRRRSALEVEPGYFVHGPYGSGACHLCHAIDDSASFRVWGTNKRPVGAGSKTVTKKVVGPRLLQSEDTLCLSCHDSYLKTEADILQLELHEPVAKGQCIRCHNPHRAERRYMLLKKDNIELCTDCHEKEEVLMSIDHREDPEADCLECHNPHMGKTAGLLKADYNEWERYLQP